MLFLSVSGVLKGYDPLLNLVLDGATEYLRGTSIVFSCEVRFIYLSIFYHLKSYTAKGNTVYFSLENVFFQPGLIIYECPYSLPGNISSRITSNAIQYTQIAIQGQTCITLFEQMNNIILRAEIQSLRDCYQTLEH